MSSVQEFLAMSRKNKQSRRETIPPGVYRSKVIRVEIDNRYQKGAVVVTYELKDKKKNYTFKEVFIDDDRFERTVDFFDYLSELGIENLEDFVGCEEELDLKWNFTAKGRKELTIDTRKFLGFADDEADES